VPGPSASEVTTLWCYINLFIIIIIEDMAVLYLNVSLCPMWYQSIVWYFSVTFCTLLLLKNTMKLILQSASCLWLKMTSRKTWQPFSWIWDIEYSSFIRAEENSPWKKWCLIVNIATLENIMKRDSSKSLHMTVFLHILHQCCRYPLWQVVRTR